MESTQLSRRERQIMDVIYARGEATASDVLASLPDAPTRVSVRTLLRILEEKGHLTHLKRGREFVYLPTRAREQVGQSAFHRLLQVFFGGSLERALAAHLSDPTAKISQSELHRLSELIKLAKKKENQS